MSPCGAIQGHDRRKQFCRYVDIAIRSFAFMRLEALLGDMKAVAFDGCSIDEYRAILLAFASTQTPQFKESPMLHLVHAIL